MEIIRNAIAAVGAVTLTLSLAFNAAPLPADAGASAGATLAGNVPRAVADGHAKLLGHHPSSATIALTVALPLRDRGGLDSLLASAADAYSPNYHHYLTLDEANNRFNPTADQEQHVIGWLHSNGMRVVRTYPNHLLVDVRGTFAQAEQLLHVTLNDYEVSVAGKRTHFYSTDRDPTIDAPVSADVSAIDGLDDFPRGETLTNGVADNVFPYYPQDFAYAYDVNPLWNAGYTGSGQHIGIVLPEAPPSDATLQSFASKTGASTATTANGKLHIIPVDFDSTNNSTSDASPEGGIDIEYSSGMAPGATIDYYEVASGGPEQFLEDALNEAGTDSNNNLQISSSWGACEEGYGAYTSAFIGITSSIFSSNAATGHDYLFASGDSGSRCFASLGEQNPIPTPIYPASSPYVTSVGGTSFKAAIGGAYPGETAWSYNSITTRGSGGGYSKQFTRPSWQTIGSPDGSNQQCSSPPSRGYPDVSADADTNTGGYLCWGGTPTTPTTCFDKTRAPDPSTNPDADGTSLAAPLWAGMLADINQYTSGFGRTGAGFINPTLYYLGNHPSPYAPFHDIADGSSNLTYTTKTGWDAVTGWGSPDAWNLARDMIVSFSYEAEASNNTLTGSAVRTACSGCSGGQKVTGIGNTGTVQFNNVNVGSEGSYRLLIYYSNPDASNRTVQLTVGSNSAVAALTAPPNSGGVSTLTATVHLEAGDNTIKFSNPSGPAPDIDRIVFLDTSAGYEAESSTQTLGGGASVTSCSGCSGGQAVTGIGNGGWLQFNNVDAASGSFYTLSIAYTNGDTVSRSANYNIDNGYSTGSFSFPATGGWTTVRRISATVWLQSGSNTLLLWNPSGPGPNIDRIDITLAPESEEAEAANNTLAGGAIVRACGGCSGGEDVGYVGNGGTLQFNNIYVGSAGTYNLLIAYANGDATSRSAYVSVNGAAPSIVPYTFWPTGGWTTVGTLTAPVTLATGENTIKFSNSSGWAPDFDKITVYG